MGIKLSVSKASGASLDTINRMDVFDFFILFHNLEEQAEKSKLNGRRG